MTIPHIRSRNLHITVGTTAERTAEGQWADNFDNDLRLLKAAILYADVVKFWSFKSSVFDYISSIHTRPLRERIELLSTIFASTKFQSLISDEAKKFVELFQQIFTRYLGLCRIKRPSKRELLQRLRGETLIKSLFNDDAWKDLSEAMEESFAIKPIKQLIEAGTIEYLPLTGDIRTNRIDNTVRDFVKALNNTLEQGNTTYPLFDEVTAWVVNEGLKDGTVKASSTTARKTKQIKLAALLLERLPLFDQASIDEILDIRRELERPLVRFRSAVIGYSDQIKAAPWDRDFEADAENLFYKDVEPTVLEIEDAVKSNSYLAMLVRKIVDKPLTIPVGSTLAMAMSQLSSLPMLAAQALGIGLSAAPLVYDTTKEWKEKQIATEQNQLFFYYKARKELGS